MSHYSDAYEFDAWNKKHPDELPGDGYSLLDTQIGGNHYKKLKIQPIEYILANELGFCEGNIVKYISRWREKGGVEDLKKIKQYCDFLIEQDNL